MLSDYFKKILSLILNYLSSVILTTGLILSSPYLCSISWRISIYRLNNLDFFSKYKKKTESKKKILVFYRTYGVDDLEYLIKDNSSEHNFIFFQRSDIKKIFNKFFSKYLNQISDNNYMVQNKDLEKIKENYKIFIKKTLEYFINKIKISGIISFNFRYYTEKEVHKACNELGIKFIVCHKESLIFENESEAYINLISKNGKYDGDLITVYTEQYKKYLLSSKICEEKNIHVIGMPRADYYFKKNIEKKEEHILFLIPAVRQPFGHEGEILFDKDKLTTGVTKTLVEFAKQNPNENIVLKSKIYYQNEKNQELILNSSKLKNCKFVKGGDSRNLIKDSKIVIGFNTTGLIEALINKKKIIIPFLENEDRLNFERYSLELKKFANYVYTKDELLDCLNKICSEEISFNKNNNDELNKIIDFYIGNNDGNSTKRLDDILHKTLN